MYITEVIAKFKRISFFGSPCIMLI